MPVRGRHDRVDAARLAGFRADLTALAPGLDRLGVAVSGGPDSLALLLLAQAALPGQVRAATVDHGLRPEAAAEAATVAGVCAVLGVPHAILAVAVGGGNLMAGARAARYEALAGWAATHALTHVAVAHHRDDVAETFLMRAARGSGVGGLARMRPARGLAGGVTLIRPLLGWCRADLAAIVAASGISPIEDPTNVDPRYDRARFRRLLAEAPALDPARLAASAMALGDAEAALAWLADAEWPRRAQVGDGVVSLDPAGLPRETLRRLVGRALAMLTGDPAPPRGLDGLVDALLRGEIATLAGIRAVPGESAWRFAAAPPRSG